MHIQTLSCFADKLFAPIQTPGPSCLLCFQGHVLFRPTVSQQQSCPTCSSSLLNGDFKVTYDVNRDKLCDLLVSLLLTAQARENGERCLGERPFWVFSVLGGQQLLCTLLCTQKPDQHEQEPGFCD